MIDRRQILASLAVMPALAGARGAEAAATARLTSGISRSMAALEIRSGGRLGVAVLNTANGKTFGHRADERFAMCSTFKALIAGFVLRRVDLGKERLDRRITYGKGVLMMNSPATEKHVEDGMTVGELCEATVTLSDNAAANLLLDTFGGPAALTAFLRGLGDKVTRCDGYEPGINVVKPGEIHDTTSPNAMLATLRTLTLGAALSPASRQQIVAWLVANQTGDKRLRAGLPAGWKVGDKTGSWGDGKTGTTNDIGVIWPRTSEGLGRPPLLITAYLANATLDSDGRNAVIAEVARLVVASGYPA
ncbi:class A beta-lactamase [soil metagenome]